MPRRRHKSTLKQRMTPCECCGYPISQRHHLFEIAHYGESDFTRQLCANCHELYHLIEALDSTPEDRADKVTRSSALIGRIVSAWGKDDPRFKYLCELYYLAQEHRDAVMLAVGIPNMALDMTRNWLDNMTPEEYDELKIEIEHERALKCERTYFRCGVTCVRKYFKRSTRSWILSRG